MLLRELLRNHTRTEALRALAEGYGQPGPKGWSVTEVLQQDRRIRGRLLDLLVGVKNGKPGEVTYASAAATHGRAGTIALRTVTGQPFTITKVRPDPDIEPSIVENLDGVAGPAHHTPRDWTPQTWTVPPVTSVPLCDDHNPANCGLWLLLQWGYGARQGGGEKRRWGDKKQLAAAKRDKKDAPAEALDRWQIIEEAYEKRHPKSVPPPTPRAKGTGASEARAA